MFGDSHCPDSIVDRHMQTVCVFENLTQRSVFPVLDHGPEEHFPDPRIHHPRMCDANRCDSRKSRETGSNLYMKYLEQSIPTSRRFGREPVTRQDFPRKSVTTILVLVRPISIPNN